VEKRTLEIAPASNFGDPITPKSTIDRWCLDLTADPVKS
jgi:hypothetical protein